MTDDKKSIVDWRTWLYLQEHCEPFLLDTMKGRVQIESTPEQLTKATANVDRYVVLGLRWPLAGYEVPNDYVADYVADTGGKAVAMTCIHPDEANAAAEFERCVTKLGMRGLALAPFAQDFHPLSESAWKLYDMANELKVPVALNQFFNTGYKKTKVEYADPMVFDPIALRYPELKIVVGHLANPYYQTAVMMLRKHPNLYADVALMFSKKLHFYNAMQFAMEYDVTDRLLFGSDSPFQAPDAAITQFNEIVGFAEKYNLPPIPQSVVDDILYNRPLSILGV